MLEIGKCYIVQRTDKVRAVGYVIEHGTVAMLTLSWPDGPPTLISLDLLPNHPLEIVDELDLYADQTGPVANEAAPEPEPEVDTDQATDSETANEPAEAPPEPESEPESKPADEPKAKTKRTAKKKTATKE